METIRTIIGIDPDCGKSGVCTLRLESKAMHLQTLTFPALLDYLLSIRSAYAIQREQRFIVVVEAGWLVNKSNYHAYQGRRAEKISKDVGANHETGRKIIEMCRHYGIKVVEQHPLKKYWRGKDGKITHEEIIAFTTISDNRTNQEQRDAALIAWCYANLPIVINRNAQK